MDNPVFLCEIFFMAEPTKDEIKDIRAIIGVTQQGLAVMMGKTVSTIAVWETRTTPKQTDWEWIRAAAAAKVGILRAWPPPSYEEIMAAKKDLDRRPPK